MSVGEILQTLAESRANDAALVITLWYVLCIAAKGSNYSGANILYRERQFP